MSPFAWQGQNLCWVRLVFIHFFPNDRYNLVALFMCHDTHTQQSNAAVSAGKFGNLQAVYWDLKVKKLFIIDRRAVVPTEHGVVCWWRKLSLMAGGLHLIITLKHGLCGISYNSIKEINILTLKTWLDPMFHRVEDWNDFESIGGRLTEPWSILTETRSEQLTEWLKNDWSKNR